MYIMMFLLEYVWHHFRCLGKRLATQLCMWEQASDTVCVYIRFITQLTENFTPAIFPCEMKWPSSKIFDFKQGNVQFCVFSLFCNWENIQTCLCWCWIPFCSLSRNFPSQHLECVWCHLCSSLSDGCSFYEVWLSPQWTHQFLWKSTWCLYQMTFFINNLLQLLHPWHQPGSFFNFFQQSSGVKSHPANWNPVKSYREVFLVFWKRCLILKMVAGNQYERQIPEIWV